jgi:serine/threonine protein kinase
VIDDGFVTEGDAKLPFYVMSRYPGTLRRHLPSSGPPHETLQTFVKVLDAVEAAHLSGVWHRDLKPENILIGPAREVVVADFGIAHFGEDLLHTAVETRDDAKLANFAYAAPEQRQRGTKIDQRADIFALGLILNELFTGEIPHGKSHKTIGAVAPNLAYLDALVDQMLHQDPQARPETIGTLKQQLIARGHEFVALQKLSELRKVVVPATDVPPVPDVSFVGFDYRGGTLLITLDEEPPRGWMRFFQDPPDGHSEIVGYGPHQFSLRGRILSIAAPEQFVERVVAHAQEYARKATRGLTQQLADEARRTEQQAQEALKRHIEEEEERARIRARLSKLAPG